MARTLVPREDHTRHKGHGPLIRYTMSKEELEEHFNGIKRDEEGYRQRNLARFHKPAPVTMREPTLEDQMSIYDLEGVQ